MTRALNKTGSLAAITVVVASLAAGLVFSAQAAWAGRIENTVAVFSALDKVTARISSIEVPLNETVQFGSLKITPRVCYSRPATERPQTTTFVEVREVQLDSHEEKIFSGWMFAESPGLNAVEHPVFDVWLADCRGGAQAVVGEGRAPQAEAEPVRRRRVRR